jgi:hypothetical protein
MSYLRWLCELSMRRVNAGQRGAAGQFKRYRPVLELLEDRRLPSTWMVTSTADDGSPGTLRWAITSANYDAAFAESIIFQIGTGEQSVFIHSALDSVAHANTTIDATTQPAYVSANVPFLNLEK